MTTRDELKRIADAEAYLEKHGLTEALSRAVDQVIKERPSDPFAAIVRMLGGSGAGTSKLPTRAAAREYADLHQLEQKLSRAASKMGHSASWERRSSWSSTEPPAAGAKKK